MKLVFLVPDADIKSGGHLAQIRFCNLCNNFASTEIVTYRTPDAKFRTFEQVLDSNESFEESMFVIHWGPHVSDLALRLRSHNLKFVYFAHSTGWGADLDDGVPIICVSKNTQSIWGRQSPRNLILNVPNVLDADFYADDTPKDIDVLIQKRKSSDYLINHVAPELAKKCNVVVLDEWVDSLSDYFRRSRVYLYDSVGHWLEMNTTEGFGLPPMEAMACGCVVYSSVNDALSDYLDPGFNCGQIGVFSLEYDVDQILMSVKTASPKLNDFSFLDTYREENVTQRLRDVFDKVYYFYKFTDGTSPNIPRFEATPEPSLIGKLARRLLPRYVKAKLKQMLKKNS